MTDEIDRSGRSLPKDSRQDRLKLALRENLKRRKLQARERGKVAGSVQDEDTPPDSAADNSGA